MVIVAGEALVDALTAETKARRGNNDEDLCRLQREQASRGILGAEVVCSNYGHSVRYDSGLQNFGLLAGSRCGYLDGTLEHAERWAREWVAKDPARRYAWRRKTEEECGDDARPAERAAYGRPENA